MSVYSGKQLVKLEREVTLLRRWVLALGVLFVAAISIAATAEPQELTLRKLTLVDRDGKMRMQTSGGSVWEFWDAEGNLRSLMGTPKGAVSLALFDLKGNERIAIVADDRGSAGIWHRGSKGKRRIHETTSADGIAAIMLTTQTGEKSWSETTQ